MVDYDKRLVEVDEILGYLSEDDLLKIPEDIRQMIKYNKNKEYTWKYDESKELKDQDVNRDTIIILSYLNMEYLLNQEQKELMERIHKLNELKSEELKRERYKPEDLFNGDKVAIEEYTNQDVQNTQMIEYKENIFTIIIKKIKKFFKMKR